jgi:multiple sugar transport system substrate-binding protein
MKHKFFKIAGLIVVLSMLLAACGAPATPAPAAAEPAKPAEAAKPAEPTKAPEAAKPAEPAAPAAAANPLKGQKIEMSILGIGGWVPSRLGVDMSPLFAEYAKKNYGYDVTFTFQEAPFSDLFQKANASLLTKSQEYNIIISDSQWLGAFAEEKAIVNVSDLIKKNPELDVKWASDYLGQSYQVYPDGSGIKWGLPQEADVVVLYVRQDMFSDPKEIAAYKAKYNADLPQTFADWEKVDMDTFKNISEFFTRKDKNLYGTAYQYSKVYDFMTMFLYPFMFSNGGEIWDPKDSKIYGVLNSEINAKAMEANKAMLKYQPEGALQYDIAAIVDAFTTGKIATGFQWAAMGPAMIPDALKGKVLVVPPPAFKQADGSLKRVYSIGGQPWVINAYNDAAHMQVAVDFLKWWYLPETQLEYAKRGGNPSDAATVNSKGFEDIQPWFQAYKYMMVGDHARDFWHEPTYAEMLSTQQEGFTAFASGQVKDAKNTLEWIACQQQKIQFEAGRSTIAAPDSCKNVKLDK